MTWYNRKRIEEKYNVSDRGLMTASEIKEEFGIPTEITTSLFEPVEWHHTNIEGNYEMTWYNRKRIEEKYNVSDRGLMTASEIKEEFGIPTEITTSLFEPTEWHHTNVEGNYGGNPTYFYDSKEIEEALNDPTNEKHNVLMKALGEYKDKKKFREIKRVNGYFGYSNPDGSNAIWFKGTAILVENGYGSRWWILPNGQRKREIEFISEEEFERKRNKFDYSHEISI